MAASTPPRAGAARFDNVNLLRALAALGVVVYHVIVHAEWSSFPAAGPLVALRLGWMGVDVFFVISGFVISYSGLILYRQAPQAFARAYWSRRLTRIVPLYVVTLALWIAFMWPGFFRQDALDWAGQLFSHLGFVHSFWPQTFGSIDGPNWSVSIEMQFYVAIALLIAWIDRTPGWRIWLYGILVSWAWRACMVALHGDEGALSVFMHTTQLPGSLDEFGAGIFLAKWVLGARARPSWRTALAWIAGACIAGYATMGAYWPRARYWDDPAMVIFWHTPLSVFLACVVGAAVCLPQSLATRWLRPLGYLGDISYGIYLWHLFGVMLAIEFFGKRPVEVLVATLAFTLAAAAASWHLFERRFMDLARRPPVPHEAPAASVDADALVSNIPR